MKEDSNAGSGCSSHALLAVNARIQKAADNLRLQITNYEGFARGGWGGGEDEKTPAGMWVFAVSPVDPTGDEPHNIVADNITEAIEKMESSAKYFYG